MVVTEGRSLWRRWLEKFAGAFAVVEYYDGRTMSGVIGEFDDSHVELVSTQRKNREQISLLANLSEVRFIRQKK